MDQEQTAPPPGWRLVGEAGVELNAAMPGETIPDLLRQIRDELRGLREEGRRRGA